MGCGRIGYREFQEAALQEKPRIDATASLRWYRLLDAALDVGSFFVAWKLAGFDERLCVQSATL